VAIALMRCEQGGLLASVPICGKTLGPELPRGCSTRGPEEEEGLTKGTDFGCENIANVAVDNDAGRRGGGFMVAVCAIALLIGLSGCTYNPLLGKWKIDQRTKETYVSYVDPLSTNIKKHTGNDTIEFRNDTIVVSGGPNAVTEDGIHYQITELEGANGTEVKIYQPRKDDPNNYDIDVLRVTPDGKSAHLETPSETAELKRVE
jgi:hypothetical protein